MKSQNFFFYFFDVNGVKYTDKRLTLGSACLGDFYHFTIIYRFGFIKRVDKSRINSFDKTMFHSPNDAVPLETRISLYVVIFSGSHSRLRPV